MKKLEGKVALLTGATSGLALASAKSFVDAGAYVFITGRDKEKLNKAVATLGEHAVGIQADSSKLEDLDKIIEQVKQMKGRLDVLFVSAAAVFPGIIGSIAEEDIRSIFELNVIGTVFTVQKALPLMSGGGSIILVGSIASKKGWPGGSVYAASKAAIRSFGRTWAAELVSQKIRVNTLSPGPIDTPAMAQAPQEMYIGMNPMKRLGTPEEIASAALFLASDESSFITGSEISVDGGMGQL